MFPGLEKSAAPPPAPGLIPAMKRGKLSYATPDEVEYEIASPTHMYTETVNLAPMFSSMKGGRSFMSSKYFSVTGDSVVLVRRADGRIYYGPINEYAFVDGDTSPSIDENKNVIWRKVEGLSRHLFGEALYEIALHSGRKFTVTRHHSCVTIGEGGELKEIYPENMGRYTPVPRVRGLTVQEILTEFCVPPGNKHNARPPHTFKLDFDFGWLVGIYLAEGCVVCGGRSVKSPTTINIAAIVPEIRAKVSSVLSGAGVTCREHFSKSHGKVVASIVHWKQLAERILQEFGTGSASKRVPGWVFASPADFRRGIIAGYLDGDGSFSLQRGQLHISAISKSKTLRDGLSMILSSLSIDSCLGHIISGSPFATNGRDFYRLHILAEDYGKITGLVHPKKSEMLAQFEKSGVRERSWVPAYGKLKAGARKRLCGRRDAKLLRTAINQDQLNFSKIAEIFGDDARQECPWLGPGVRWDYVSSVTELPPTDTYVYDIHMSDNVFMVGCGVFVHNSQALPMAEPEAPLVSAMDDDTGDSFDRSIGTKIGITKSPFDGVVKKVDRDRVTLVTPDKKTQEVELKYFYPSNRKSFSTDTPLVKPGDQVRAGQPLAHSNYVTPDGELALGKNLKVAFMPGRQGGTFEDSITVSESGAKKLTSTHLYGYDVENKAGATTSKAKFMQLFPNKYTKEQLDKIDDNGMVKPGAELNPGDPVFLSVAPRTLRAEDRAKGNLHKILKRSFTDRSQTWEKSAVGKVVDAVETKRGYAANIAADFPVKPGDKLCMSPDHDVLTRSGWKKIEDISLSDVVATRKDDGALEWLSPSSLYRFKHSGRMYSLETAHVSMLVTDNHRLLAKKADDGEYGLYEASELFGTEYRLNRYCPEILDGEPYPQVSGDIPGQREAWENYSGPVYCLGLPRNHVFMVRRNGKCHWTGNSSRYAAKGVVGRIVPDDQMFKDASGETVDILINPAAMIGRVNPGMVYEALLGKIARKTGKKYVVPSFSEDSFHDFVKRELEANQVPDTEDLFDPVTQRKVPKVLVGVQNFLKLEHTADAKLSAIDEGTTDQNEQPGRPGGSESAKRVGFLDLMALLSHGATKNLADIQNYRTGSNVDMWRAIRLGQPLPAPKVPFIYEKFTDTLRAAGINPDKKGSKIALKALKRADIDELVGNRELQNADTIDVASGEPVPGGLMDQGLHGIDGRKWSYIKLDEPMPNPILEEALRKVMGLTEPKMRDVLAGKEYLEGKTGPQALVSAFESMNLDRLEEDLRNKIRTGSKSARDDAVRRLNVLAGIKKQGLTKDDLFVEKVPVLPASFRPVSTVGKMMLSADANYLYKDLMTARDLHRQSKEDFGESEAGEERLALYDALTAVVGLGDPLHPKLKQKGVKGFIRSLAGSGGPKTGQFLSRVVGHTVNTVGRGVAIPSDEMDMDSIGLPAKMAWKLYAPFVMRRMVKNGMPAAQAALNVERKTDYAKKFLVEEMDSRPVLYNRAPALHRFSVMSSRPRLVAGDSIQVSPLIVKGFNLDFDGDQINIHVPVSDEAVKEAGDKLMPSKNLLSIKDRKIFYQPSQEFVLGLYNSTSPKQDAPRTKFKDASEVIAAYRRGEISIDTPVEVGA